MRRRQPEVEVRPPLEWGLGRPVAVNILLDEIIGRRALVALSGAFVCRNRLVPVSVLGWEGGSRWVKADPENDYATVEAFVGEPPHRKLRARADTEWSRLVEIHVASVKETRAFIARLEEEEGHL